MRPLRVQHRPSLAYRCGLFLARAGLMTQVPEFYFRLLLVPTLNKLRNLNSKTLHGRKCEVHSTNTRRAKKTPTRAGVRGMQRYHPRGVTRRKGVVPP